MAVRQVLRTKAVLEATGWARSTLYAKIAENKFPRWTKLDPEGQTSVWWADEVELWQAGKWSPPVMEAA